MASEDRVCAVVVADWDLSVIAFQLPPMAVTPANEPMTPETIDSRAPSQVSFWRLPMLFEAAASPTYAPAGTDLSGEVTVRLHQ